MASSASETLRPAVSLTELRVAPAAPRRYVAPLLIGVIVIVIGALISGLASAQAGHRSSVLAVAKPIAVGQVIRASDIEVVRISTDPRLRPVLASNASTVVGHPASVSLIPGTLVTQSAIGPAAGLGDGNSEVGLSLKAGQYPPSLAAGQKVRVISTDPNQSATLVDSATVLSIGNGDASSSTAAVIGLEIPAAELNAVAADASTGHVSLGLLPS